MTRNGLALKARADLLAANIRGARAIGDGPHAAPRQRLGDQIGAVRVRAPRRTGHTPTTRTLDGKGRLRAPLGDDGSPLTEALPGCGVRPVADRPGPADVRRGDQIGAVRVRAPRRTGHTPTTRTLDGKGRLRAPLGDDGSPLTEVLGCGPGPLSVQPDGIWLLLRPAVGATKRRHDGRPTLGPDGRLRLPTTVLGRLGLTPGSEVALVVAPEIGALAVCNPADLLAAAPPRALGVLSPDDDTTDSVECEGEL